MGKELKPLKPKAPELNVLEQVEDPQHRVDVMGYRLAERIATQSQDPVVQMLWANLKNPLADYLNQTFGPEPARVKADTARPPEEAQALETETRGVPRSIEPEGHTMNAIASPQFQAARVMDVLFLGPFMIWFGFQTKTMPDWARATMAMAGLLTMWFNANNYIQAKGGVA